MKRLLRSILVALVPVVMACLVWAAQHLHVMRFPNGALVVARSGEGVGGNGARYRPYVVGIDAVVRVDFYKGQSRRPYLRWDGVQNVDFIRCALKSPDGWTEVHISRCEAAWNDLGGGP